IEQLQKSWNSLIYAFFKPTPEVSYMNQWQCHKFACMAKGCKHRVQCFLDKGDAGSTRNMIKHVKSCWGEEVYKQVTKIKNLKDTQELVKTYQELGSIDAAFKKQGGGKICYSHQQHTRTETKDCGFKSLMKTGRLEYYLPSRSTISRDVCLVFANCQQQMAKMMREYKGQLSFATDAWTSPNHKAFVAVSVHLEHSGKLLCIILDIVEVAAVSAFRKFTSTGTKTK
ncbi:hypothetical protein JAAARDRAFT_136038, partial [Jaapia argillacea MUCL 33604]